MKIFSPILKGTTTVSQGTTNLSGSFTGSLFGTAATASYADNFTVGGTLTAQTINVQIITSSIEFNTGSTRNGALSTNTHEFTGSVLMSGSLTVNNGNTLSIYRPDNARALQFYTTINECIIDSWEATGEPLHIRSNGGTGRIQFFTSGSEKMRITSAGNVGIGTTNPTFKLEVTSSGDGLSVTTSNASQTLRLSSATNNNTLFRINNFNGNFWDIQSNVSDNSLGIEYNDAERLQITSAGVIIARNNSQFRVESSGNYRVNSDTNGLIGYLIRSGAWKGNTENNLALATDGAYGISFFTNGSGTERMIITSGGSVLVNTTSLVATGSFNSYTNNANPAGRFVGGPSNPDGNIVLMVDKYSGTTSTSQWFLGFTISNQQAASGVITANGASQAAFGSWSDRRLKENIVDLPNQLSNILALRPVEFDYIESEGGGHQISFIAQEFEEIYPDAIGERPDGMKTLTGWGKTEAILVKAIQELKSENDTLKEILQRNNIQ